MTARGERSNLSRKAVPALAAALLTLPMLASAPASAEGTDRGEHRPGTFVVDTVDGEGT